MPVFRLLQSTSIPWHFGETPEAERIIRPDRTILRDVRSPKSTSLVDKKITLKVYASAGHTVLGHCCIDIKFKILIAVSDGR